MTSKVVVATPYCSQSTCRSLIILPYLLRTKCWQANIEAKKQSSNPEVLPPLVQGPCFFFEIGIDTIMTQSPSSSVGT